MPVIFSEAFSKSPKQLPRSRDFVVDAVDGLRLLIDARVGENALVLLAAEWFRTEFFRSAIFRLLDDVLFATVAMGSVEIFDLFFDFLYGGAFSGVLASFRGFESLNLKIKELNDSLKLVE